MKHQISVKSDDITNGIKGSACSCPIALALQREFPSMGIEVSDDIICIGGSEVVTPDNARKFILDFDKGRGVAPITLELDIP